MDTNFEFQRHNALTEFARRQFQKAGFHVFPPAPGKPSKATATSSIRMTVVSVVDPRGVKGYTLMIIRSTRVPGRKLSRRLFVRVIGNSPAEARAVLRDAPALVIGLGL